MALVLKLSTDLKKKRSWAASKTTVVIQIETITHLMDIVKPC